MKKLLICVLLVSLILSFGITICRAESDVTFAWENPTAPDLAGIRLYQDTKPFDPNDMAADPNKMVLEVLDFSTERATLHNIPDGTYWWVATAFDTGGNESTYSNQVIATLDSTAPGPPEIEIEVIVKVKIIRP